MFTCFCEYDYDEYSEFYNSRNVIAKKTYQCSECSCKIEPGEKYEYAAGKCDGSFWTTRTCSTCAKIRNELLPCGHIFGQMWLEIHKNNCGFKGDDDYFCICPERKKEPA